MREQGEWHERSGALSLDLVGADLQPLYAHYERYRCEGGGGRLAKYDVAVVGAIAVCWDGGAAARISRAACNGD